MQKEKKPLMVQKLQEPHFSSGDPSSSTKKATRNKQALVIIPVAFSPREDSNHTSFLKFRKKNLNIFLGNKEKIERGKKNLILFVQDS